MKLFILSVFIFLSNLTSAQSIDYETMSKQWVKLANHQFIDDYEFGTWFLKNHMSSTYNRVKNDEFELNDEVEKATKKGHSWLNNVSNDYNYTINTTIEFGKYDFKTESFPLEFNATSQFFYDAAAYNKHLLDLPSHVALTFNASPSLENLRLKMPKAEAKQFIKARKNKYGDVNRNVLLTLMTKVSSAGGKSYNGRRYLVLKSDILSLEIYDDKNRSLISKIM